LKPEEAASTPLTQDKTVSHRLSGELKSASKGSGNKEKLVLEHCVHAKYQSTIDELQKKHEVFKSKVSLPPAQPKEGQRLGKQVSHQRSPIQKGGC
jgi:hypothetical protein